MLWSLIAASLLLLAVVLRFEFGGGSSDGWSTVRRSAEMGAAVFLGVTLATLATDSHESTRTVRGLCLQTRAAVTEVRTSIAALERTPRRETQEAYDEHLLILTSPARLLVLLVANRDYIEYGDPKTVPKLATLSSTLSWQPFPKTNLQPGYPAAPARDGVLYRLRHALELLHAERRSFCDV